MKRNILIAFFLSLVLAACAKQDRESTYTSQEQSIDTYLSGYEDDGYSVVRNGGANRLVIKNGSGTDELAAGDSLYFHYSGYIFSNGPGTLFVTNDTAVANANSFVTEGETKGIRYGSDDMIDGLKKGLNGVKSGENCYIVFSAKYGYANEVMFNVPRLSPLFFDINVDKIVKN